MTPKKIIIFGTGGNCIDILDTLLDINDARGELVYECAGFLDDHEPNWGKMFNGVPVLGPLSASGQYPDCYFVNGIGSVNNFWKKETIIASSGLTEDAFETIIHPTASVSRFARLGKGVVVYQNVTITSNANIGNHVVVLPGAVISHDDIIGDYTCIAGGVCISGGVTVGKSCYLGTNCCLNSMIKIGDCSLVGMGSVVLRDVPDRTVVVGNPARFLRQVRV